MVKSKQPIRSEDLTAYERWELPNIEGGPGAVNKARSAMVRKPVKPLTADDIEKIRLEAYKEGFKEGRRDGLEKGRQEGIEQGKQLGHKEGFQKGTQDAQSKIDQIVAQLRLCLESLANPIQEQGHVVEQAILNLALAVSRAVIHRELKIDSSQILQTIQNSIRKLPDFSSGIKVKLNPADVEYINQAADGFDHSLELLADPSVQAGGCFLETSSQLIDFTIEKRFQKTVHALLFNAVQQDSSEVMETSTSINELSDYSLSTLEESEQDLAKSVKESDQLEPDNQEQVGSTGTENDASQSDLDGSGDGHESI